MKERIAKRLWPLISWECGINKDMAAPEIQYEDGPIPIRALCKSLAQLAIDEIAAAQPSGPADS